MTEKMWKEPKNHVNKNHETERTNKNQESCSEEPCDRKNYYYIKHCFTWDTLGTKGFFKGSLDNYRFLTSKKGL